MVNANSGVNCCKSRPDSMAGDVYDDHTYVGPGRPVVHDERDDRTKVPDKPSGGRRPSGAGGR